MSQYAKITKEKIPMRIYEGFDRKPVIVYEKGNMEKFGAFALTGTVRPSGCNYPTRTCGNRYLDGVS